MIEPGYSDDTRTAKELIDSFLSGQISEEDADVLLDLLEKHENPEDEFARELAGNLWVHCLTDMHFHPEKLPRLVKPVTGSKPATESARVQLIPVPSNIDSPVPQRRGKRPENTLFAPMLVGAMFLCLMTFLLGIYLGAGFKGRGNDHAIHGGLDHPEQPAPENDFLASPSFTETKFAFVRNSSEVQWADDSEIRAERGELLGSGWIRIRSGKLDLLFSSGTEVTLEGPADFRLIDENRTYCAYGEVAAKVPRKAIGFQVDVPQTILVDLGSPFGVSVGKENSVVHIDKGGQVELRDRLRKRKMFSIDEPIRISNDGQVTAL